jgi:hypothetical protein
VSAHLAGDPGDEELVWTYLSTTEIADRLAKSGTPVCRHTVAELLEDFGLTRRRIQKTKTMGQAECRNEQFENIARLTEEYRDSPNPIVSMDTKKKEFLGDFARPGTAYGNASDKAWDHDYASHATGVVIPHGLYDERRNVGHITLGTSRDTSEFACDSLYWWWQHHGRRAWPQAQRILLKCDGGGSNNSRHYIFKEDLQRLVNRIGLPIEVAHYPPYCSKYNPIEHRLFPHVQRAWSGVMFRSYDIVVECLKRVWTSAGLRVTVKLLNKSYELGRKASERFLSAWPIQFADELPQWNYTVIPISY